MKKNELLSKTKLNKKIKDLDLDLQIKILGVNILNKQKKGKDRDYKFYLEISNLLKQAQKILSDKYYESSKEAWPEKGLLGLLREKNSFSGLDHNKVQANTKEVIR